jgi:hypothetical protein
MISLMKECTKDCTMREPKKYLAGFEVSKMEIMGIEPMTSCKFPDLRLVQSMRATAAPYPPRGNVIG